ncbi:MAG: hypothetical protein NTU44_09080 [Bacteroidetes bacterium]|nr:hypothetical protein [Bacteroidota bacterium]
MRNSFIKYFFLLILFPFFYLVPAFAQQEILPVKNELSLNIPRLLFYRSVELMYSRQIKSNQLLRIEAVFCPAKSKGTVIERHPLLASVANFRKVSDIYGLTLGYENRYGKGLHYYYSGDIFYEHWSYNKTLYDNGSGMTMDQIKKLQSETRDIYGIRILIGYKALFPRYPSRHKLLLDFYFGESLAENYVRQQVYGIQESNDPWDYYDPPLIYKERKPRIQFHLGLRLGFGWSAKKS